MAHEEVYHTWRKKGYIAGFEHVRGSTTFSVGLISENMCTMPVPWNLSRQHMISLVSAGM